jgi:hypothetical protein
MYAAAAWFPLAIKPRSVIDLSRRCTVLGSIFAISAIVFFDGNASVPSDQALSPSVMRMTRSSASTTGAAFMAHRIGSKLIGVPPCGGSCGGYLR